MTEENTNVGETTSLPTPPKPVPNDRAKPDAYAPPKVVKEAEHKLKEMSRKAKERKTAHNASKNYKALNEANYFWLVIGGLGALGVGYLVFGKKDPETKPRQRFKFVPPPKPKTPEKPKEEVVEKEEKTSEATACRPVPKFELNCF